MKRIAIASIALALLAGTAANAAPQRYDDHRYDRRDDRRDERRAYEQGRRDQARYEDRQDRREYRRWAKGQRLDARYRGAGYYVSDYRRHGLRQPPRGYRWQKVNDQYVLAAIATGLIASVIIANN